MNLDQIKANAPEGATHYDWEYDYFKLDNGIWYMYRPWSKKWNLFEHGKLSFSQGKLKPL